MASNHRPRRLSSAPCSTILNYTASVLKNICKNIRLNFRSFQSPWRAVAASHSIAAFTFCRVIPLWLFGTVLRWHLIASTTDFHLVGRPPFRWSWRLSLAAPTFRRAFVFMYPLCQGSLSLLASCHSPTWSMCRSAVSAAISSALEYHIRELSLWPVFIAVTILSWSQPLTLDSP